MVPKVSKVPPTVKILTFFLVLEQIAVCLFRAKVYAQIGDARDGNDKIIFEFVFCSGAMCMFCFCFCGAGGPEQPLISMDLVWANDDIY